MTNRFFYSPRGLLLVSFVGAQALGLGACGTAHGPAKTSPTPAASPAASGSRAAARPREPVVPAARTPVVSTYHGTRVTDDYAWLENAASPETQAFTAAQNAHSRAYFDALPERPAVRERLTSLLGASSADYLAIHSAKDALFVLVTQPPKPQPVLVVRTEAKTKTGELAAERVLLDPGVFDPTGVTTIDFFVPSPDAKRVAVSLSKNGSERGDVRVFDVATGRALSDVVTHVNGGTAGGSLAWNADGSGFFYTRYPRPGERAEADLDFYQQVYFHKLGSPEASDTYVMGAEFPRIAEIALERSDDGKALLVHVENGDGGEVAHYVWREGSGSGSGSPRGREVRLAAFADDVAVTRFGPDGRVWGISRKGAPRGSVVVFTPPFDHPPETIVPEGDGVFENLVVTKNALYVMELVGGPSRMRRLPLGVVPEPLARDRRDSGRDPAKKNREKKAAPGASASAAVVAPGSRGVALAELPIPAVSSVTAAERVGENLLVRIESYLEPPAWFQYLASEHRLVKTAMAKAPPADMSDVEVVRDTCVSNDGTRVPMSVLRKRGTKLDSTNPTLLTGYGGYSVSLKPKLRAWHRVWLEHGGVLAEANLRGGGELGAAWHDAGKLTKKQNVFDDFAACAKTLFDRGYTTPARLAASGRSNGGLLMGAALVQHPEMFRAVVSGVGIYDMLRVELHPNGAFNVTEFGTVTDEAQFRALYAYSPFHNVRDGAAYPAVLLTTGAHDPRVDPYHSRKMAARLQAATASDRPILLSESANTGHGAGTPLAVAIDEGADMVSFLFHELGVVQ